MTRKQSLETCLAISTGLILLWLVYEVRVLLVIAFITGLTGLFLPAPSRALAWLWFKLGEGLGYVVSRILMTLIFYLFLLPIALVYRLFNKDTLRLRRKPDRQTIWTERNHTYSKKDLEQIF